jgi:hypothetical protein
MGVHVGAILCPVTKTASTRTGNKKNIEMNREQSHRDSSEASESALL